MNNIYFAAVSVASIILLGSLEYTNNKQADPIPVGCEATPIELKTEIADPKATGFDKIDEFNMSAKLFRSQTLAIADNALKLTVTMCQVNDAEIGEYTHRECFTGLGLTRTDDCKSALIRDGKGVVIERIAKTLVDGAVTIALGVDLVAQAAQVSESTLNEVKGNPMKLKNARGGVKSLNETVTEVNNSLNALRSAMKFAEGSKAAIENWDLQ